MFAATAVLSHYFGAAAPATSHASCSASPLPGPIKVALLALPGGAEAAAFIENNDQGHLVEGWDPKNAAGLQSFIAQFEHLQQGYPGGLVGYITKAQKLLLASANEENPFEGMTPEIPSGTTLQYGSPDYVGMEDVGSDNAHTMAFVLVAGGLGERLGYGGIKIALPSEITTGKCYLNLYIDSILAIQRIASANAGKAVTLPLAIMTSGDTHDRTVALLKDNNNFGMAPDQITLMKQEKVASLYSNKGHISRDSDDAYQMSTKPHGHGDVHYLLYKTGTAAKWQKQGSKWLVFFQDTNAMLFRPLLAAIGVSVTNGFIANSMTGPREAKRAMGGIIRLKRADGTSITNNVEYNQLDPLLRAGGFPDGDVAGPDGFSPFPGNMNQLVFNLDGYMEALAETQGLVPEFVNPKYADASRQKFKKPTRLECMMQDLPRMFKPGTLVGFTTVTGSGMTPEQAAQFEQSGLYTGESTKYLSSRISFYSPVKNNVNDAAANQRAGKVPGCASIGEADVYTAHCKVLLGIGVNVAPPRRVTFGDGDTAITVDDWPHVVIAPGLCVNLATLKAVFPTPGKVNIAAGSTLVLSGPGKIVIHSLDLNGALIVRATNSESTVEIGSMKVVNGGLPFEPLPKNARVEESIEIRGYQLGASDAKVIEHNDSSVLKL